MDKDDRMTGLRFTYESGDYVEDVWKADSSSKWETRDIPQGYEIIGMFVTFRIYIEQFGFYLWPIDRGQEP